MSKTNKNLENSKVLIENTTLLPVNTARVLSTKETSFLSSSVLPKKIISNCSKESLIFNKKKSPIKTISYMNNDSGKVRHFTPAAQEWFNSIYSFNKNYIKTLPSADKNLMKLLRSYFNFFINPKLLKTKRIANRYRKLSANKVFIGKGELKHTNEKVIITNYIYNAEKLYLKSLIRKEAKLLYYPNQQLKRVINTDKNKKGLIMFNRPFTLKEFLNEDNSIKVINHPKSHKEVCFKLFWKKYIKFIGINRLRDEEKINKVKEKMLNKKHGNKEKADLFIESVKREMINLNKLKSLNNNTFIDFENPNYSEFKLKDQIEIIFYRDFSGIHDDITYQNFIDTIMVLIEQKDEEKLSKFKQEVFKIRNFLSNFDSYMVIAKNIYLDKLHKLINLFRINTTKFKTPFLGKLLRFIKNIYNKKVELNIVNLNKFHLNSDIYTQLVALKLRNRDNKLFRVLTWSLNKVKLPNVSRVSEKYNVSDRNKYLVNKIRNMYVSSMLDNKTMDPLNGLLLKYFSGIGNLETDVKKRSSTIKQPTSLYRYIIKSLKHFKLAGIRIEAKGRLTRRFTASRSVFKMKWKGGLKNVDSSFKGLSAIMLRGDRKSNVQYSMTNSRNRNGAYGVKGWISGK